ncbi:hypothetical protein ACUOAQ_22265, partial [Escherichia sp. SP-MK]
MEISLLQAFALGIIAFIAGLDMFNGLTHMQIAKYQPDQRAEDHRAVHM